MTQETVGSIQVGTIQGSCFAVTPTIIITAGHVAQSVGRVADITVDGHIIEGTVAFVSPGSPEGPNANPTATPNDFAIIRLASPTNLLKPLPLSAEFADGLMVTASGFAGKEIAGVIIPSTVSTTVTAIGNTTQFTGLLVDNAPMNEGASGGPVLDASGHVVGLIEGEAGGYQYITQITPLRIAEMTGVAYHLTPYLVAELTDANMPALVGLAHQAGLDFIL